MTVEVPAGTPAPLASPLSGPNGSVSGDVATLSQQMEDQPRRVDLVFGRGVLLRESGEFDKAVQDFTKVLELEPGHRSAYLMRGEAHRHLGHEDLAIQDYTKALFIDPQDVNAYLIRGEANLATGHYTDAVYDFTKALDLVPSSVRALKGRAAALSILGRHQDAFADIRKALQFQPDNPELLRLLAQINLRAGHLSEAMTLLEALIKLDPSDIDTWVLLGEVHRQAGRLPESLECFSTALELNPDHIPALYGRGETHRLARGETNMQLAYEDCWRVLELDPEHAGARAVVGEFLRLSGRYEEAVDAYTKALDHRLFDTVDDTELYIVRGESYMKLGMLDKAMADLNKAISLSPGHMHAYVERCECLRLEGDFQAALKDYNTAVQLGYFTADRFVIAAILHRHSGNFDLSQRACNQALAIDPHYADVFSVRGFLHLLQGSLIPAKNDLNKAQLLGINLPRTEVGPKGELSAPRVVVSRDAYDCGVVDAQRSMELVPRHTYLYGSRVNHNPDKTPEELVQDAEDAIRKLMLEYGLLDDQELVGHLEYILGNVYMDNEEKLRMLKELEERIKRSKAAELRANLCVMWDKLGLTEPLRGRIYEEIQIEMENEAAGLPVDMELLERVKMEALRLQTIRESAITEANHRFQEWGRLQLRCNAAWEELGTVAEERISHPFPGWELMDRDVELLAAQTEHYEQLVAEKRERDAQAEGATFFKLVTQLLELYDDCKGLWAALDTPKNLQQKALKNLGTEIRQAEDTMSKEKARLTKISMERQEGMYEMFDRSVACFNLLKTKPALMRTFFLWEQKSLHLSSLRQLEAAVMHLEFKAEVPKQKIVIKEIKGQVKEFKRAVKRTKDKIEKKEIRAEMRKVKDNLKSNKQVLKQKKITVKDQRGTDVDKFVHGLLRKRLYKRARKVEREDKWPLMPTKLIPDEFGTRPVSLLKWNQTQREEAEAAREAALEAARLAEIAAAAEAGGEDGTSVSGAAADVDQIYGVSPPASSQVKAPSTSMPSDGTEGKENADTAGLNTMDDTAHMGRATTADDGKSKGPSKSPSRPGTTGDTIKEGKGKSAGKKVRIASGRKS